MARFVYPRVQTLEVKNGRKAVELLPSLSHL